MTRSMTCMALGLIFTSCAVYAKDAVTPDNYIRAEVDGRMLTFQQRAGGVNQMYLFSEPTPTDEQPVVRMNRDTLYGGATIDTAEGASITIPKMPDDRYVSVLLLDNDHYTIDVLHEPGKHVIPKTKTRYIIAIPRIQIYDAHNKDEVKMASELLKQFKIEAKSAVPKTADWDWQQMMSLRKTYEKEFVKYDQYLAEWQDTRESGVVNDKTRHLAVAGAWGLFPQWESVYINYTGPEDASKCYTARYQIPENKAFWSITVYGADAFMKGDNVTLNASNVMLNEDGESFDAYFGSQSACGKVNNRVDITQGWNFLMRVYKPAQSVLDGEYKLPQVTEYQPVKLSNN